MYPAEHLAAVEELLAGPVPGRRDLRVSEHFLEDDGTARPEAEDAFGAECQALTALLTRRWGAPELLDLAAHHVRLVNGADVPEPLRGLCQYIPVLHRWQLRDRWFGLGVGAQGTHGPLQLVAAVGGPG